MMKLSFQLYKIERGPGRATAAQLHSLGVLMFFLEFTVHDKCIQIMTVAMSARRFNHAMQMFLCL